jgi:isopentenyldiphosphate isomerase
MTLAQNPDELFDVVDAGGASTGIVKRRGDVHRDGDWHRAIHVWVIGVDDAGPYIVFQRRSLDKDTWPGELDCTVGGHLGAGESTEDAYREVEEEIGIRLDPANLRWIGRRVAINEAPGLHIDHEIQDVFFLRDDRDLLAFQPNPHELDSLVKLPLDSLLDLLAGDREAISGVRRPSSASNVEPVTLTRDAIIHTTDGYFYRVAIAARNHLRGDRHVAV